MNRESSAVRMERGTYCCPPPPCGEETDYYLKLAREILASYGRKRLEQDVTEWVLREARWLKASRAHSGLRRSGKAAMRTAPGYYVQEYPWSRRIRTTKTIFTPTHYHRVQLPKGYKGFSYMLQGLYVRVTEDGELMWVAGEVNQPIHAKFERALVEHLPDETLAAFWDKICRY